MPPHGRSYACAEVQLEGRVEPAGYDHQVFALFDQPRYLQGRGAGVQKDLLVRVKNTHPPDRNAHIIAEDTCLSKTLQKRTEGLSFRNY